LCAPFRAVAQLVVYQYGVLGVVPLWREVASARQILLYLKGVGFFMEKYFVYILQSSKDLKYYIGSTSDVDRRLAFHNAGLQKSTKNRIPFIVIRVEEFQSKKEALIREKKIKSFKGGNAFKKLFQ
jgi:putative endonuclease